MNESRCWPAELSEPSFRILTRSVSTSSTVWSARKVVTVLVEIDPGSSDCCGVSGWALATEEAAMPTDVAQASTAKTRSSDRLDMSFSGICRPLPYPSLVGLVQG